MVDMAETDRGLIVSGPTLPDDAGAEVELVVPALLVRWPALPGPQMVHVYVPRRPTVAFTSRDLRSPGIVAATEIAREAGFHTVVRSPGGRMVAYDAGAVVIDHLSRTADLSQAGGSSFADNAANHARLLRSLGSIDARVGEVDGEYCPGEFSVNVGGTVKVIGSAQRVTRTGSLFSTVVQVEVSDRVGSVIAAVSDALGYALRGSSIAGLKDFAPGLTPADMAEAFKQDYRLRLGLVDHSLPASVIAHAQRAADTEGTALPFNVDDWSRANPLPLS